MADCRLINLNGYSRWSSNRQEEIKAAVEHFVFILVTHGAVEMINYPHREGFAGTTHGYMTMDAPERIKEVGPNGQVRRP